MLIPEAMTLAIMKWRLAHLSPGNRWAPVLERYIKYSVGAPGRHRRRLVAGAALTHLDTAAAGRGGEQARAVERELCGKVAKVLFDCHGEFEGFVLDDCCDHGRVESRDPSVADLVLRACRENLTVCVRLCPGSHRLERLTIEP